MNRDHSAPFEQGEAKKCDCARYEVCDVCLPKPVLRAIKRCEQVARDRIAHESYQAVREAFDELRAQLRLTQALLFMRTNAKDTEALEAIRKARAALANSTESKP